MAKIEELWHTFFRLRVFNQRLRALADTLGHERKQVMALLDASNADLTILAGQITAALAALSAAQGASAPADVTAAGNQDTTIKVMQAQLTAAGFPPAAPAAPAQS
jgi:predicted phosphodiesterase